METRNDIRVSPSSLGQERGRDRAREGLEPMSSSAERLGTPQ